VQIKLVILSSNPTALKSGIPGKVINKDPPLKFGSMKIVHSTLESGPKEVIWSSTNVPASSTLIDPGPTGVIKHVPVKLGSKQ